MLMFLLCLCAVGSCAYDASELEATARDGSSLEHRWLFYVDQEHTKMVSVVTDSKGKVNRDCYASGDKFIVRALMDAVPDANVTVVKLETVDYLARLCTYAKMKGSLTEDDGQVAWDQLGQISGFIIYPGTKWCGAGNISSEYDDLGPEVETDTCCRAHDHCDDHIEGYGSNHGLRNTSPFTKSNCDCDDEFYRCLQRADTRAANRVGRIFFNFIQMECFREDHPVTGCKRYRGRFRRTCQEYEFDLDEDPIWQWFDAKHYEPRSDEDDENNETGDVAEGDVFQYILRLAEVDRLLPRNHPNKES